MTSEDVLELALVVLIVIATFYAVIRLAWWIGGKLVLWAFRPPRKPPPRWLGDDRDDRKPAA